LVGRVAERERLHSLLGAIRNGGSGAAFVTGDPGIGKSTLLDSLVNDASGVTVLKVSGFEVESAVPFGAIQRLGQPLAEHTADLPPLQRDALLVAAGLRDGPPPERMLVALAALNLLAKSAEATPILCVVDEAQHLDPESLEVMGFIARRLSAESVAMVFASRDDDAVRGGLAGVEEIVLGGLSSPESAELLRHVLAEPLDPSVEDELVEATGGNPLALRELASEWDAHALTRAAIQPTPAPIGRRLERHYAARAAGLSASAQLWLLVAAAESTGNGARVRGAASALGLPHTASAEVESTGLVDTRDGVRFRHPLVRSAIYGAASDLDRRSVHKALGDDALAAGDEEIAAWHAAAAAEGPAPDVARRLVALADRAGARGGFLSRARLLARAADVVGAVSARDALLADAAESASLAGQMHLARELAASVDAEAADPVTRGRLAIVGAMSAQYLADPQGLALAKDRLLQAADDLHGRSPELEQRALLIAFHIVQSTATDAELDDLRALGERLRRGAEVATGPLAVALAALSSLMLDAYEVAVPHLRAAVAMFADLDDAALFAAAPVAVVATLGLWDADLALQILAKVAEMATRTGALRELDNAAWVASAVAVTCGNPKLADDYLQQAANMRHAVGYADSLAINAAQMAWAGVPIQVVEQVGAAMLAAGFGGIERMARSGIGCRHIADGEYEAAYTVFAGLVERPFVQASFYCYPDLVEAGVRAGRARDVAVAVDLLRVHAAASESGWAIGMWARSEALVSDDAEAEAWYLRAIEALEGTAAVGQLARTHLIFGEWLRRQGRRSDATKHLTVAYSIFDEVGAVPFGERARRELLASGAIVPTARTDRLGELTPQEAAVARLAAGGKTNAEIGSALFISPNTVDYHLRKVFRKLAITSRRQLVAALERTS